MTDFSVIGSLHFQLGNHRYLVPDLNVIWSLGFGNFGFYNFLEFRFFLKIWVLIVGFLGY